MISLDHDALECPRIPCTCPSSSIPAAVDVHRWDADWLYIAAELEEPQIWANITRHNEVIYQDNDFEVFVCADGSNHYCE